MHASTNNRSLAMPAIMQPKTVNVVSLAALRNTPLPKPVPQVDATKKPGKSFFDYLRIALSAPVA
jgi:hypothetical protein